MTRNYGISRREAPFGGGYGKPPGSHPRDIYAPRDSVLLPPGNLSLPRGQLTQAMFDVGTLFVWLLLGCLAVLIAGSPLIVLGWILFFG